MDPGELLAGLARLRRIRAMPSSTIAFALAEVALRLLYRDARRGLDPIVLAVVDPLFDAWIDSLRPA